MRALSSSYSLFETRSLSGLSAGHSYFVGDLVHLYLELKLGVSMDGNQAKDESKKALGYIAKAADASFLTAEEFGGKVLEIQGRMLHLAFPYTGGEDALTKILDASGCLHGLLKAVYGSGGPDGWRMAADFGTTIALQCPGIHGDTSIVSLSIAANRPAKKLGSRTVLGTKAVAVGDLCYFNGTSWRTENLDEILRQRASRRIEASDGFFGSISLKDRVLVRKAQIASFRTAAQISAQAAPFGSSGSGPPTAGEPLSRYGIVLSMDLDGFSASVVRASKSPLQAKRLAEEFYEIMVESAKFANEHPLDFVQFPFAGDNAIFALIAKDQTSYAEMKKVAHVRVAVEWEERMGQLVRASLFGGWAQVTAAGDVPHGNSSGNIHIAKVEMENRGFLVAVGPGVRYAREGFSQVSPSPESLAIFKEDLKYLDQMLRKKFGYCQSNNGVTSSNFEVATIDDLKMGLKEIDTEKAKAIARYASVSIPMGSSSVVARPFAGESFLVRDHRGKTRKRISAHRETAYKPQLRLFLASLRKELPDLRLLIEKRGILRVAATLHHEGCDTRVTMEMDANPLARPPKIFCDASWIRRELDWHFVPPGCGHKRGHFCWVLPPEWSEYFQCGPGALCPQQMQTQDAAIWLVAAMRLMLDRHWLASKLGIVTWPATWLDYSHGYLGLREYKTGNFKHS